MAVFGLADGGDDLERCPWFVYVTDLDSIAVVDWEGFLFTVCAFPLPLYFFVPRDVIDLSYPLST